jgi:DNA-binding XRE family transcriptional regulator
MARNYTELQAKINPASLADNRERVRNEIQRMALEELRNAKQLTQADMAEMLDVPQSSISRIEQRTDMYLSTLRNYIQAMGGMLQIQAVFPEGGAVVINRFGDYEDQSYVVKVRAEPEGVYRLSAQPFCHEGPQFSTKALKASGLTRTMKALHLAEQQIAGIRKSLESVGLVEIGGSGGGVRRIFHISDLIAAGFDAENL